MDCTLESGRQIITFDPKYPFHSSKSENKSMRPYILKEASWKELQTFRYELAVLPWGATEAHNYHLPYGTDVYEADAIAEEGARKAWAKSKPPKDAPTSNDWVNEAI